MDKFSCMPPTRGPGSQHESYTVEQAAAHALTWCAKHPAWQRICDMGETRQYYVQWAELKPAVQEYWMSEYGYNEFATKRCKIKTGFISGKGEFYDNAWDVPMGHNFMMMFRVGRKAAQAGSAREGGITKPDETQS